jgi:signal transduction histidine kinase
VAFEEMRRSLRDRLRSTESINIDLEREVRRRTEALEQRNAELRDALEKLRRAQDNLIRSEKLASMGRLVSGIAHEINNPVNAVINSLGPARGDHPPDRHGPGTPTPRGWPARPRDADRGAAREPPAPRPSSRRCTTTRAATTPSSREVNLARSVDDSLDLLRHRLRNVQVKKEVDPAARILGLPGQIDQVLMNLITNAAQALGDKGGVIRVTAAVRAAQVLVTVEDDGPGYRRTSCRGSSIRSSRRRTWGRGRGWGCRSCTGSWSGTGGTSTCRVRRGGGRSFRSRSRSSARGAAAAGA